MKNNSEVSEDILAQLDGELNESREELKNLRETFNQGVLGLEKFNETKLEIETRIDDLSNRIHYIKKAKEKIPTTEERLLQEAELLMNEYQIDYIDNNIYHMRIYLTVSVNQTWIIEVNFSDPKVPLFKIPTDLPLVIGNPYETIKSLKRWRGSHNEHLISIIREIEHELLNHELAKSLPELELERGRVMAQARKLEEENEYSRAMVFYNYAADISERIGNQAIAIMCQLKAKKMLELLQENKP
ncbi:MAG: hypothetical protein HWN66_07520 [Candidatus Helarchaeota archaeon]|nr:hypothetical protein [Candidatus Helarchaeota archaeon]